MTELTVDQIKSNILLHMDALISEAEIILSQLNAAAQQWPKNYENVALIAYDVVSAGQQARQKVLESKLIVDGLEAAEQIMKNICTPDNMAIIAEHRGNRFVNFAIDLLSKLSGYIAFFLTFPARIYDSQGVQTYINSWFIERPTDSLKIFGTFKEFTAVNLAKVGGFKPPRTVEQFKQQVQASWFNPKGVRAPSPELKIERDEFVKNNVAVHTFKF